MGKPILQNDTLSRIDKNRFSEHELKIKNKLWKILTRSFLQKFVNDDDVVVDLGGWDCEFINNVKCGEKIVVDLNADTQLHADEGVKLIESAADRIDEISDKSIDVVFVSNLFEHMKTKEEFENVVIEINRILVNNGKLLIIQPNIRFAYKEYWDFFDHYIPISDRTLIELLEITGFIIKTIHPKFLPFNTKNRLSKATFLLKIYLKLPLLWHIFGKQLFIEARKESNKTKVYN